MKCAVCNEEKSDDAFSKSQLRKGAGEAKCESCVLETSKTSGEPGSPTKTTKRKICSQCKLPDRQFSKSQQKKEDGKCVDCLQPSPSKPTTTNEEKEQTKEKKSVTEQEQHNSPSSKTSSEQIDQNFKEMKLNEDDDIRTCCESCQVYKPPTSFLKDSNVCAICAEARRKGIRQMTMEDHGLLGAGGVSHRRLSWVPDGLREYLAFHEQDGRQQEAQEEEEENVEE